MAIPRISTLFPSRIPILYAIMGVLLLVSVVPMYFYADRVVSSNRERLKANEMLLQNTVTRSVVDELTQRNITLRMMLDNLGSAVAVSSGGNLAGDRVSSPELRAILEQFVSSYGDLAYATVLNADATRLLVAQDSRLTASWSASSCAPLPPPAKAALTTASRSPSTTARTTTPSWSSAIRSCNAGRFYGMVAIALDLQFLVDRLQELSRGGLNTYVVDHEGRLVAGAIPTFVTGQDMKRFEIVQKFLDQGRAHARFSETTEFSTRQYRQYVDMLGTYSPVLRAGMGRDRAEGEARRLREHLRDAELLAPARDPLRAAQRWNQLPRRAPHHRAARAADRIQPRHRARRLLAARQPQEPHRDRRARRDVQSS
jgi:hypothetical protein